MICQWFSWVIQLSVNIISKLITVVLFPGTLYTHLRFSIFFIQARARIQILLYLYLKITSTSGITSNIGMDLPIVTQPIISWLQITIWHPSHDAQNFYSILFMNSWILQALINSWLRFCKDSSWYKFVSNDQITSDLYTCHYSGAAMTYVRFWPHLIIIVLVRHLFKKW